jgi:hypothetical protein
MNWNGFWSFLSRFLRLLALLLSFAFAACRAQNFQLHHPVNRYSLQVNSDLASDSVAADTSSYLSKFPDPHKVLFKSLIIPGWGQIINKQAYKVPIIYLLLGGLTGYSIYLTKQYHAYRAAFYNRNQQTPNDQRFGPTPPYLQGVNPSQLKSRRNSLENQRDFIYITILLAYGLNAVDAYVFAQLRSFNVSKNLSVQTIITPAVLAQAAPGITLSFSF